MSSRKLTLRCPDCKADLVVDSATGEVLFHKKAKQPPGGGQSFESLLEGLEQEKVQAEEIFEREKAAMKDRERLLEERFREALEQAEKDPDKAPPPRPFDLD